MPFTEVTSSVQLDTILKKVYPDWSTAVVAINQLKNVKHQMHQATIVNFDRSDGFGTHWTLVVVRSNQEVFYYDSIGLDPPQAILQFMRGYKQKGLVKRLAMNIHKVQPVKGRGSSACGWFVLKFLDLYVNKELESYDAVVKVNTRNTLSYGRSLTKRYLKGIM